MGCGGEHRQQAQIRLEVSFRLALGQHRLAEPIDGVAQPLGAQPGYSLRDARGVSAEQEASGQLTRAGPHAPRHQSRGCGRQRAQPLA